MGSLPRAAISMMRKPSSTGGRPAFSQLPRSMGGPPSLVSFRFPLLTGDCLLHFLPPPLFRHISAVLQMPAHFLPPTPSLAQHLARPLVPLFAADSPPIPDPPPCIRFRSFIPSSPL